MTRQACRSYPSGITEKEAIFFYRSEEQLRRRKIKIVKDKKDFVVLILSLYPDDISRCTVRRSEVRLSSLL